MEIGQGDRNASNNSSLSADNSKEDPVVPVSIGVGKRVVKYDDKNRYKRKTSFLDNLIVEGQKKIRLEKGNPLPIHKSKVSHFYAIFNIVLLYKSPIFTISNANIFS